MLESLITPVPPVEGFGLIKVIKNPVAITFTITGFGDSLTLHYNDPDSGVIHTFNNSSSSQTFSIPSNVSEFYLKQVTSNKVMERVHLFNAEITSVTWNDIFSTNAFLLANNSNLVEVSPFLPAKVTILTQCFLACAKFNQDISMWDTGDVTKMNTTFGRATVFNQDLSGWDVSKVTDHTDFDWRANAWQASFKPVFPA